MVHRRHRLPLISKAREHVPGVHAQLDHFQGHHAVDGGRLLSQVHGSHAALTQHTQDVVVAEVVVLESTLRPGPGYTLGRRHDRIGSDRAPEQAHTAQPVIV